MTEEQSNTDSAPAAVSAQNPLAIPISIVIAGLIVAGAIIIADGGGGNAPVVENTPPQEEVVEGPTAEEQLALAAIQEDDYVRGNRDAEIYVLEFSDTECPFCKRFHTTMKQVVEEYNGEVAWVYRHFPLAQLHPTAPREAEALECAGELGGQNGFWEYADQVYEQTPERSALPDEQLPVIAAQVGLDREAFLTCLNSGKYTAEVQKDLENAVALGGRGTPHSLIVANGELIPIQGAQPFNVVKSAIDSILNQ